MNLACITGATSGIGKSLAELLAKKGIALLLSGRDNVTLREMASALKELVPVETIACHLENKEERKALVERLQRQVPDILINNAGYGIYGEALDAPTEEQLKILEVNGCALLELTLEAARAMVREKKRGVILNVASIAAEISTPLISVYGASKAFVLMLSRSLDYEFSPKGVRVLVSCPGQVATEFASRAAGRDVASKKGWAMSPGFAAEEIWHQMEQKKAKHTFDWRYRFMMAFVKHFVPERWVQKSVEKDILRRLKHGI